MLHVFIGEILASMTQMSDVAPGPLVMFVILCILHVLVICDKRFSIHKIVFWFIESEEARTNGYVISVFFMCFFSFLNKKKMYIYSLCLWIIPVKCNDMTVAEGDILCIRSSILLYYCTLRNCISVIDDCLKCI
jgi:hypothetical protein